MEFKDKFMLPCFSEKKTSLGFHCKNFILNICLKIQSGVCLSDLMGSISEFNSNVPRSFPKKAGNKFACQL